MFNIIMWQMIKALALLWLEDYGENPSSPGRLWYVYNHTLGARPGSAMPAGKRMCVEIRIEDDN